MGQRRDPSPYLETDGEVAAVYRAQRFAEMLNSVVSELFHYGAEAPRVVDRLRVALEDLVESARPEHRGSAEHALERLRAQDEQVNGSSGLGG